MTDRLTLAIETSSAACSGALFADDRCIGSFEEVIGRGHSERLVPLLAELLAGRTPERLLVGVGPGSFTGIRVGIAAAQGLAIGWDVEISGFLSLPLLAVGRELPVAAAVKGGHGELLVQQFDSLDQPSEMRNLPPPLAADFVTVETIVGSGAEALVSARGWGQAINSLPSARNVLKLPEPLRLLAPKPLYARAPDAKMRQAA